MDTLSTSTKAYANTHVGLRRRNEDSFSVSEDSGLFVVADGVGGVAGGDVASHLVVNTMNAFFRRRDTLPMPGEQGPAPSAVLAEAIYDADRCIVERRRGKLAQMGSTVAAVLVRDGAALIAHVGDSRVYRLRDGELRLLTRDHNAMHDRPTWKGSEHLVNNPAYRHQLTRAVGVPGFCNPEIASVSVEPGDRFLLCTDGLSGVMSDTRIATLLDAAPPERVADVLIEEALELGADDNITVIVLEIR